MTTDLIQRLRKQANMCVSPTTWGEAADCIEALEAKLADLAKPEYNEQHERNRHDAEELEALHMCLDKHGIPRSDAGGAVYSAWGRVLRFVAPAPTDAEILETAKWALYPVKPCDENTIAFVRRLQSAVDSRFYGGLHDYRHQRTVAHFSALLFERIALDAEYAD